MTQTTPDSLGAAHFRRGVETERARVMAFIQQEVAIRRRKMAELHQRMAELDTEIGDLNLALTNESHDDDA